MPAIIPDSHKSLVDNPVYVVLTTLMPDGQPQSSVVWWDSEGEYVQVNTIRGRQKERNMVRDGRVTIVAVDPTNPYHWLEVRGVVEEMSEEGGVDHINSLSRKYNDGQTFYGGYAPIERKAQETRVKIKIRVVKVIAYGH